MHVTLIHNPRAGSPQAPESDEIVGAVEALGWTVTALGTRDIERAARDPGEMVLVAGGDGTVGTVAKRFAGTEVPIGLIPMGTANNVARTLGVGLDARSAIASLPRAEVREVDLGLASFGGGPTERFLEGVGVGAFADFLAERATKDHKKLRLAIGRVAEELASYVPRRANVTVDGRDVSGDYALAAVMNLRSMGPALSLAPEAKFDDGELDVVFVRPVHAASLVAHLKRAELDGDLALPAFEVHRAKHVVLRALGPWANLDDRPRALEGSVELRVEPSAVRFLLPPRVNPSPPDRAG